MRVISFFLTILCLLLLTEIEAQKLSGHILDGLSKEPIELATVYWQGDQSLVEESDQRGYFKIAVPSLPDTLIIRRIGYLERRVDVTSDMIGGRRLEFVLDPQESNLEIIIEEERTSQLGFVTEKAEDLRLLPSATGNIESLLPSISLGVTSGTGGELTSQYNVRGGSYDENIIMVNDFEIYKPQLITSGEQEGLSFPNIDLIEDLSFSSGGFGARYGDKISSVLDVRYKVPDTAAHSFSIGLLGGSMHTEGAKEVGDKKLRYLLGGRYRSNASLLNSQDVEGEYDPRFLDVQGLISYEFNPLWSLQYLSAFNRSAFRFVPRERETATGEFANSLQLNVDFQGREDDVFLNYFNGLALIHTRKKKNLSSFYKFMLSNTYMSETENIDIIGDYNLQLRDNLGENAGQILGSLGEGSAQDYVKNFFEGNILAFQLRAGHELTLVDTDTKVVSHFFQWGVGVKRESLRDIIREFDRIDSVGYSTPSPEDDNILLLDNAIGARNDVSSQKYNGYLSHTLSKIIQGSYELKTELGLRLHYWDANEEFFVNPRGQVLFKPLNWRRRVSFKLAGGLYYQPAFYREMRQPNGVLNTNLLSQKSAHILGGVTYDFRGGKDKLVPYRLIVEAYYKDLWDLVYYDVDNVRIIYTGENNASGYAYGLDARLNGELIPGAESWINVSFLDTKERIEGVQHLELINRNEAGIDTNTKSHVPRPSDRRFQMALFVQDYFQNNQNLRMNMNFVFGTGLPFGFPDDNVVVRNDFRFRNYFRIDLGFSFRLYSPEIRTRRPDSFFRFTKNTWFEINVFNLMDIKNVAANTWVKDSFSRYYSIPNNLTARRFNVTLRCDF